MAVLGGKNEREKTQILGGTVSVIVNFVLFIFKFVIGISTGSIALMADAWHTMSDSLTSVAVIVAAKLASKKPDKEHPFGHGRWEQIVSLFIALVLGIIAYEFFMGSIDRFRNHEEVSYGAAALVITIVSIVVKELLTQYAFHLGRKTNNMVLIADGWHHRSDALSSVAILMGIIATKIFPQFWWMDGVLGLICALMIFWAAIQIVKDTTSKLLGEELSPDLIDNIRAETVKIYGSDLQLHHFHMHNYILHKELTLHIRLDRDMTVEQGHNIATCIEAMIKFKFDIYATIHVEVAE